MTPVAASAGVFYFTNMDNFQLTISEQNEFERCEVAIKQGLETFIEVGTALMTIRNKRLYRAEFETFEEYCRDRWGMEYRSANRLIAASETISNLGPIGPVPITESQARPLTSLQPEVQREAWAEVVETHGGNITATKVQEVADRWKSVSDQVKQAKQEPMFAAPVKDIIEGWRVNMPHVTNNSGNNEWYTPREYIEAARAVMGRIDLDPASCELANKTVQARHYFSVELDGLAHEWEGKVWMNPPYASGAIEPFTEKLVAHVSCGDIEEAIVLVNNATETRWFQDIAMQANAVCLPKGRIKYYGVDGEKNSPLQGQAFLYFGDNPESFFLHFSKFGLCLIPR